MANTNKTTKLGIAVLPLQFTKSGHS